MCDRYLRLRAVVIGGMLSVLLLWGSAVSTVSAQTASNRRTVVDYYLLLPDRYLYGVAPSYRQELLRNQGRIIAKDVQNGYLAIAGDAGDPGTTIALFKKPDGERLIGVAVFNEMEDDMYLLRYRDGKWTDLTRSAVPGFSKAHVYKLPRYGTTIQVNDKDGKKLYNLVWSRGKFRIQH